MQLKLNPFCDLVVMENCIQFRLPTKVVTLEGESATEIVRKILPLLDSELTNETIREALEEYDEKEVQKLIDGLINESILGKYFPKNILSKSSLRVNIKEIEDIKEDVEKDVNIGIAMGTGNVALALTNALANKLPVISFQVKEFSDANSEFYGKADSEIPLTSLNEFVKGMELDYVVFLPEKIGIAAQRKLEQALEERTHLITGFRKDAVYYVASTIVGKTEAIFLRVFRGLFLSEDLLLGKHISQSDEMISVKNYFSQDDARWIGADLAKEILSFINKEKSSNLANRVIIYDLPLVQKRFSSFIELPERILSGSQPIIDVQEEEGRRIKNSERLEELRAKFVGEAAILPEVWLHNSQGSKWSLPFYSFLARYSCPNPRRFFIPRTQPFLAGGVARKPEIAELKAIMEGIERYSSGFHNIEDLRLARATNLEEDYINPTEIVGYHLTQYTDAFPFRPFSKDEKFFWKKCVNLTQNKVAYIIADCIFYPLDLEEETGMRPYTSPNSSGGAAHFSWEEAIKHGIFELCERDAFMIVWFNKLSMPLIDIETLPKNLQKRIKGINLLGFEVYLVSITMDLFPVILAIAVNENAAPTFTCGAASSVNVVKAVDKALAEMENGLYFASKFSSDKIQNLDNVSSPRDHATLFYDASNFEKVKFLFHNPKQIPVEKVAKRRVIDESLGMLCSCLNSKGLDVIVADVTSPDVSLVDPGIKVVKVFIPKLVPIYFGNGLEPLGVERIFALPKQLGYRDELLGVETINRFPHPFP